MFTKALATYGALQLVIAAGVAYVVLNPRAGRSYANAHPEVRGGGDLGFGGLDFYEPAQED